MPDTRIFDTTAHDGVGLNKLVALSALLADHGVTFDPAQPTGEAVAQGWDARWTTPQEGQIAITVVKHPFAEEGIFWNHLAGILGEPVG